MIVDKEAIKNLVEKNLLEYVGVRSITNSTDEKNTEGFFEQWFSKIEYFKNNPEHCGFFEIPEDYLNRKVVWCLIKGEGDRTIVFIHHYDIVETKNYGSLESLCFKPYELAQALKAVKTELTKSVEEDLFSDNWIFGRGVSDMKGGAAIQLSLIEEYSRKENFKGNIVLISVPDEENLSAGMRGAVIKLKDLKKGYNLDYKLMLNSEPHERGDDLRPTLYDGSIGKVMPLVYTRGKLAHVGQVYSGLNPINLLAEIICRTDLNSDFIERFGNTTNPPPTWLYNKDGKIEYDVSLPASACGYMSILPLKKTPKEIMDELKNICIESFETVTERINKSYEAYTGIAGLEFKKIEWKTKVKFYSELYNEALRDSGEKFEKAYINLMSGIKEMFNSNRLSIIEASILIIEKTLQYIDDTSPCVILALAPPYYPSTNNNMLGDKSPAIYEIIEKAKSYIKYKYNEEYTVQNYFTGISDLSYAMYVSDKKDIEYISSNMLIWKDVYYIPFDVIKEISMPVINVGPWGKDLHKNTERVYKDDLFYKTPELIDFFISEVLNNY